MRVTRYHLLDVTATCLYHFVKRPLHFTVRSRSDPNRKFHELQWHCTLHFVLIILDCFLRRLRCSGTGFGDRDASLKEDRKKRRQTKKVKKSSLSLLDSF